MQGNRLAQKELYERYKRAFFIMQLRYAANRCEAQDFLQDGWVKIFSELHSYDENKGAFYSWARRIMVNTALTHLRKKRILFAESEIEKLENNFSTNANVIADLNMKDLTTMISSLPVGYRVVFNMFVIEGYSHKEIAQKLDISVNTSKTQLFKAKKSLQKKIDHTSMVDQMSYGSK